MDNYNIVKLRNKHALKIARKKQSASVIMAFAAGLVSVCVFIILCIISAVNKGAAGECLGIIPFIFLAVNIVSFVVSYRKLKAEDIKKGLVSASACINEMCIRDRYLTVYVILKPGMP